MGSLENFHQEIVQRLQSGELQLGVSKMAGAAPSSVAYSKSWTLFPFVAAAGYCVILWHFDYSWWWLVIGAPVAFLVGVLIRRNRGMAKASRLARADPYAFDRLWTEGALSLKLTESDPLDHEGECVSPDDYRKFIARHFLRT